MRQSYAGSAPQTNLSSGALSTDTTLNMAVPSGYPNAAIGPFVIVIDRGGANEEKVLIQSYTTTTMSVATGGRGYDGTTATAHQSGETVNHCIDSLTINQVNLLANSLGTVTPAPVTPGNSGAGGVSTTGAAADHVHQVAGWGTAANISTSTPGDSASAGASGLYCDAAHAHAVPGSSGGGGTTIPSGMVFAYAAGTAPPGWLTCDGSAVSRTTYSSLYSAIGTTFGAGDGSTTFNLPDLRGRTIVADSTLGTNTQPTLVFAATGGEAAHALVTAELALHTHTDSGHTHTDTGHQHVDSGHGHSTTDPGHIHEADNGVFVYTNASSILYITPTSTPGVIGVTYTGGTTNSQTSLSVNSGVAAIGSGTANLSQGFATLADAGSGTAHNNMQPYLVMIWVIKE